MLTDAGIIMEVMVFWHQKFNGSYVCDHLILTKVMYHTNDRQCKLWVYIVYIKDMNEEFDI